MLSLGPCTSSMGSCVDEEGDTAGCVDCPCLGLPRWRSVVDQEGAGEVDSDIAKATTSGHTSYADTCWHILQWGCSQRTQCWYTTD